MKIVLFLLLFLSFSHLCSAQMGLGSIRITAYSNPDNRLKNNVSLDSVFLVVTNYKGDTIISGQNALMCNLTSCNAGNYILSASYGNFTSIEKYSFVVSSDRITFIDLLFEPKVKKRKKFVTPAFMD